MDLFDCPILISNAKRKKTALRRFFFDVGAQKRTRTSTGRPAST